MKFLCNLHVKIEGFFLKMFVCSFLVDFLFIERKKNIFSRFLTWKFSIKTMDDVNVISPLLQASY